jgi:hypothetical protein
LLNEWLRHQWGKLEIHESIPVSYLPRRPFSSAQGLPGAGKPLPGRLERLAAGLPGLALLGRIEVRLAELPGLYPEVAVYRRGDWLKLGGGVNQLIADSATDQGGGAAYYVQHVRLKN